MWKDQRVEDLLPANARAGTPARPSSQNEGTVNLAARLAQRSIRVAVSECLLGAPVRWDGEHNADIWPRELLEAVFSLVGLCPEVGVGMGVPRPPIQLIGNATSPRAVAVHDQTLDYTDQLASWRRTVTPSIADVSGYVFADRSPSCGLTGVKVHAENGKWQRVGTGIHAAAVASAWPELPLIDAEDLRVRDALERFAVAVVRHAVPDEPLAEEAILSELATHW